MPQQWYRHQLGKNPFEVPRQAVGVRGAMRVLLTGASGFIGSELKRHILKKRPWEIVASTSQEIEPPTNPATNCPRVHWCRGLSLNGTTDWREALTGIDVVIHLGASVHRIGLGGDEALKLNRTVNFEGTRALFLQAAQAGVRRFVFISTAKVHGEKTQLGAPWDEHSPFAPQDPYAISKAMAERFICEHDAAGQMGWVIIRPPLVYGPGVRANFRALAKAVAKGLPLPFGKIDNLRSLVGLHNLVDFIIRCVESPEATGQAFLVSDDQDLSTRNLVKRLAQAMNRSDPSFSVPIPLLKFGALALGQSARLTRLCDSLQLDIKKAHSVLAWSPPFSVDAEIRSAIEGLGL